LEDWLLSSKTFEEWCILDKTSIIAPCNSAWLFLEEITAILTLEHELLFITAPTNLWHLLLDCIMMFPNYFWIFSYIEWFSITVLAITIIKLTKPTFWPWSINWGKVFLLVFILPRCGWDALVLFINYFEWSSSQIFLMTWLSPIFSAEITHHSLLSRLELLLLSW
jgi:hypothetical protein